MNWPVKFRRIVVTFVFAGVCVGGLLAAPHEHGDYITWRELGEVAVALVLVLTPGAIYAIRRFQVLETLSNEAGKHSGPIQGLILDQAKSQGEIHNIIELMEKSEERQTRFEASISMRIGKLEDSIPKGFDLLHKQVADLARKLD